MMLKYISGLKNLFESQPQFFTSRDPKQKALSAGALGMRLFIVEKFGSYDGAGDKEMVYVNALNVAATDSVDIDPDTGQFKYPDGVPVLTPEEVAAVGSPQRDLVKFTELMNELIPSSQLFHIPTTIKGLRVPGEEAWALLNINKGQLHMRMSGSIGGLAEAKEVPVSECGTVEGDHRFAVPLHLIKLPLDLNDKVAYSFIEKDGNYYFVVRASEAVCVYCCMPYVENVRAPEIVEEKEQEDGEEPMAKEAVEEAAEEPAAAESGPEGDVPSEEADSGNGGEAAEAAGEPETPEDGSDGNDTTDGDAGSTEGDGDSVGDGSGSVDAASEDGEAIKPTPPDDLPLMETLDVDMREFGRRLKSFVSTEIVEYERMRKNIAKQVRPLAKRKDTTPDTEDLKKKLAAVEADRDALAKKLAGVRQELAPYSGLLKINWKLLD